VEQYFQEVFSEEEFHAVNVGCNKGFDAVNILRMGSNNASISRSSWSGAMPKDLAPGVCGQESEKSQYEITQAKQSRKARVLCVEPLPVNFIALEKAAQTTRFDGLSVLQYALNNEEPGSVFFPKPAATNENTTSHTDVGAEKKGIADCFSHKPWRRKEIEKSCQEVRSTRLDEMMQLEGFSSKRIDFMLIDVEGWDFEVLKGGNETLKRTSYLEFEYNWVSDHNISRVFSLTFPCLIQTATPKTRGGNIGTHRRVNRFYWQLLCWMILALRAIGRESTSYGESPVVG
jgi:FkbM family methyltransferase